MSFFTSNNKSADGNNGSLNDILTTPSMRTELATITALSSDAMRRELLAIFEPITQPRSRSKDSPSEADLLVDFGESVRAIEGKDQAASRLERLDQADIQSTRTQGLRRAAVTHFDKWQVDVLRRIGEVLSVRPDAIRKARADAKRKGEAAEKAKRDQMYWNWANGVDTTIQAESQDRWQALPEDFQAQILSLPKDKRILILDSVLLLLLSLEHYSAHSRVLMLHMTRIFRLPESTLIENESKVAEGLLSSVAAKTSAEESTQRQASQGALDRKWKVGLATIAGATLIGVTGGLAAPFLAAGIGGIMGGIGLGAVATLLGPLATNVVLVGGLFGAYGGKMTGGIVEKYTQEIKDFKFLPVSSHAASIQTLDDTPSDEKSGLAQLQDPETRKTHKLRVAIGISGSVTDTEDFIKPWTVFSESRIEAFGLRWEMNALLQLGQKMSELVRNYAISFAGYQLLSVMVSGLWPFAMLSAAKSLDSPFAVAKSRSDKAGKVLADALINKVQGVRPVTLVGYGLGSRVVYSCLAELAEHNAFGLVESAVFMGTPAPSDAASWRRVRAMVSGRVVNVFSADDFLLGLLYRASSLQMGIAGIQEVTGVMGVENYDFTDMVKGHDKYKHLVGTILQRIGFGDLDAGIVKQQQDDLKRIDMADQKVKQSSNAAGFDSRDDALAKEDEDGHIVLVDDKHEASSLRPQMSELRLVDAVQNFTLSRCTRASHDGDDESDHQIRMEDNDEPMSMLEPEPEPDAGPDREIVSFGTGARGFNVEWETR